MVKFTFNTTLNLNSEVIGNVHDNKELWGGNE